MSLIESSAGSNTLSNSSVLTIDVDWAPDWMIESVTKVLMANGVKSTWFVTHKSPAIMAMRDRDDLFEIGIHPNCLAGSDHGSTEDEVLTYLKGCFPDAVSMRTHCLYQTTAFLERATAEYGIEFDVSLFLPRTPNIYHHWIRRHGTALCRIPFVWADDNEMFQKDPIWTLDDDRLCIEGLRVFSFHPVHLVLNAPTFDIYEKVKSLRDVQHWDPEFVEPHLRGGLGPKRIFEELIEQLSKSGSQFIKELVLE